MIVHRSVRAARILIVLAVIGSGSWLGTRAQQPAARSADLPSPEQFFGYQDGRRSQAGELGQAARRTTRRWPRPRPTCGWSSWGRRSDNRPYVALFISSPANLAKLDRLRQLNARLADPRGLSEAEAQKIVAEARAVVIQSFALHSSEVAASQTAAEFVYDSVTRKDEEAQRMLDNVISIVVPSINPDGTQMIADWYMEYVGTPYEAADLPWLYQKYSGHDNNRDGFALNLPESQHLAKLMYRDWMPQAYVDHHQMGSGNARLYIPPYAEPIRPDGDPLVWREIAWWGAHMGNRLEAGGKTGVIGNAIYSGWGHMGFHWITPFHNIAGMLTESASARLATPMYIHPDQLRGGPRNLPEYEVADQHAERLARRLVACPRHRRAAEDCRVGDRRSRRAQPRGRAVEHVSQGHAPDRARREGRGQGLRDSDAAARFADREEARQLLLNSGVEVHQTTASMTIDGRVYGPGSFVVSMAQPKMGLIRWMLGRTFYPDNTYTRDREGNPIRPYDMATDVFSEFMGVRCDPLPEAVTQGLTKMTAPSWPAGTVAANAPNGYVLSTKLNDAFRAVSLLLDKGATVRRVPSGEGFTPGDFIVTGAPARSSAEVAKQTGVDFAALSSAVPASAYPLRKPRIAMYQRYGGGNMDEGWSRLMFEQFNIPVKPLMDAEIRKGDLNASYDAIILPADSSHGDDRRDAGPGRPAAAAEAGEPVAAARATGGSGREGGTPPAYRSGFGAEGVKMLQAFVQKGGHARHLRAGRRPADSALRPAAAQRRRRTDLEGVLVTRFDAAGALRPAPSRSRSACRATAMRCSCAGSQAYEVTASSPDVEIFSTFVEREILQSGWLLGEGVIAKKAAAVSVDHGAGRVVLLGFRPQHRDQTHGTFKLVFNALFTAPPAPAGGSQSQ